MTADVNADVVVIGSGPAGVSVTHALLEAGLRVLLLDNGTGPRDDEAKAPRPIWDLRGSDPDQADIFLGDHPSTDAAEAEASTPKMRVPAFRSVQEGFARDFGLTADGIMAVGARTTGGLSRMWGAGVPTYRAIDMAGWPVDAADMSASYRRVAHRIGVAGEGDVAFFGPSPDAGDLLPPVPLPPVLDAAWQRYAPQVDALRRQGFRVARARNAVATCDRAGRLACSACGGCLYGCPSRSIYDAADDLPTLSRNPDFRHVTGVAVRNLRRSPTGGYEVLGRGRNEAEAANRVVARGRTVVLAAGTLGSTILAARLRQQFDTPIALQAHPAFALAFLAPRWLGAALPERFFALSSLCFSLSDTARDEDSMGAECGFGSLFPAAAVPASELVSRVPLSRPSAAALVRLLQPAMVLANCYLPGHFAEVTLQVGPETANLRGRHAETFAAEYLRLRRRMAGHFRRLGLYTVPTSATVAHLGSDGHFVAGVPMTACSDHWGVSADGELNGISGVYVADGAALPSVASRHPTFTIMANADRIGRAIASRFAQGAPATSST